MPYIGYNVTNAGSFAMIDDISSTFNGSNTSFTLNVGGVNITPNTANLLIAIDGVVQQAPDAYTVSGSTINFTGAPASGADFYGVLMGQSSYVENNSIGADELNVSGDGTSGQVLKSDGDGTFSWLSQSSITAPAGSLTGSTLASGVTASSLTSVGTLTSLTGGTGDLIWDTTTLVVDSSANMVGIGTASPEGLLSFLASESNTPKIRFQNTHSVTGDGAISSYDDTDGTTLVFGSNFYLNSSGASTRFNTSEQSSAVRVDRGGLVQFYTGGTGSTATERMRISSSGNVIFQDGCPIQADTGRATGVSVGTSYVNILDFSTLGGVTGARGFYLVTVVRNSASVGTSIVLLIGVSTASNAYIYDTVSANNLTAQMSGANLQVKVTSGTVTCHATAIPIGITGTD